MEMTVAENNYKELLMEKPPKAIHSEREYHRYLARVEKLLDTPKRSVAETNYLELLTILIESYENTHHEPIVAVSPLNALRELMLANNTTQSEIGRLFGSSGIASEVLSGKRELSKAHIKTLSELFNVSPELFI